jgi:hypothetical protein
MVTKRMERCASTSSSAALSAVVAVAVTASSLPKIKLSSVTGPSPEYVWIRALVERRMKQWHQMRQKKHFCILQRLFMSTRPAGWGDIERVEN